MSRNLKLSSTLTNVHHAARIAVVIGFGVLGAADQVIAAEPPSTNSDDVKVSEDLSSIESKDESGKLLRFQFSEAIWPEVLSYFSTEAGLALDMTKVPEGTFNYSDNQSHSVREAIDILNGYLLPRGVVLLRRDRFLVSIGTDDPNLPNMIPVIELEELSDRGDNELLRVAVPLSGFELAPVAEQLRGILGASGVASPIDSSDAIVLQGFGKSLRTAVSLIQQSVAPPSDEELTFRSFPLRHVAAAEAERQIQSLIGLGQNPFQASMRRRRAYYDRRSRRRRNDDDRKERPSPNPLVENLAMNMKISSLRHTNSLLVTATPAGIELIEQMLDSIDVPSTPAEGPGPAMGGPVLRVYTVDNADEDDVAETIEAVIPGVVINEDGRNNSIHIFATEEEHREVKTLISTIDSGGIGDGVEVIPLTRSNPIEITSMLAELFSNEDRDDRPSISPGLRTRSIVVRGTSAQLAEIRKALESLGEGPNASGTSNVGNGPVRRIRIGDRSRAKRIAGFIKELMREDSRNQESVRVIETRDSAFGRKGSGATAWPTVIERTDIIQRVPTKSERVDGLDQDPKSSLERPGSASFRPPSRPSSHGRPIAASTASKRSRSSAASRRGFGHFAGDRESGEVFLSAARQDSSGPVTVEIEGDDILIYSDDEIALDEIESMIRDLVRQLPSRKQWSVFYLRAAPVQATAQTLVDLLRANSFTETYLGVGPEYELDAGIPTTMRIVPDARTNALFVSGPDDQIDRAAEFIRYLDTTDLPASLRDRIPRTIKLLYADASTVAELIRELFKDLLVDPDAVRRSNRRSDRDRDRDDDGEDVVPVVSTTSASAPGLKPSGIQLTVAVDETANALLVACNEQIFKQIESVATQRDRAARDNQPTTTVLSVSPSVAPFLESLLSREISAVGDETGRQSRRRREGRRDRDD